MKYEVNSSRATQLLNFQGQNCTFRKRILSGHTNGNIRLKVEEHFYRKPWRSYPLEIFKSINHTSAQTPTDRNDLTRSDLYIKRFFISIFTHTHIHPLKETNRRERDEEVREELEAKRKIGCEEGSQIGDGDERIPEERRSRRQVHLGGRRLLSGRDRVQG